MDIDHDSSNDTAVEKMDIDGGTDDGKAKNKTKGKASPSKKSKVTKTIAEDKKGGKKKVR